MKKKKSKTKKLLKKISKSIPSKNTGMTLAELEEVKRDIEIIKILNKYVYSEDDVVYDITTASFHIRQYIKKLIKDNKNG